MRPSQFNVSVPLKDRDDLFLMNTFTDAQIVVSPDVAGLLDRLARDGAAADLSAEEREAVSQLVSLGFVVPSREAEQAALSRFFEGIREDTDDLRVTVLTTLQCNFACEYCYQGDHAEYNKFAHKMSLDTAERVGAWVEERLDAVAPRRFVITFFGGEPLLNLPVLYRLSERLWEATQARGVPMHVNIITNGLLLTPEVVARLAPFGLNGVKVTLDGDRGTHDRLRPLRGGQGTFDRIVENIRRVADRCPITIGGNFDPEDAGSYAALLDFLREQDFADRIAKVAFKPIIRGAAPVSARGTIALTPVGADNRPLGGTCMTSAGSGGSSPCDSCHFVDEAMTHLREATRARGFATVDGVHMGPCELHRRHAYTIGPDGSLYACPGFTGDASLSTGHIDGRNDAARRRTADRFERHAPWQACGDCSFIPVCGGGCSVAAHAELGDMGAPSCHKSSFESALVTLAHDASSRSQ